MTQSCNKVLALLDPELFAALADANRAGILARLCAATDAATVSEIAAGCPIDLSVVSRHIRRLREAGLLVCEKRGRQLLCRVDVVGLAAKLRALADALETCCPDGICAEESCTKGDKP